jgi:hypothetical protein
VYYFCQPLSLSRVKNYYWESSIFS